MSISLGAAITIMVALTLFILAAVTEHLNRKTRVVIYIDSSGSAIIPSLVMARAQILRQIAVRYLALGNAHVKFFDHKIHDGGVRRIASLPDSVFYPYGGGTDLIAVLADFKSMLEQPKTPRTAIIITDGECNLPARINDSGDANIFVGGAFGNGVVVKFEIIRA